MQHLSSTIYHLPSTVYHLPSTIHHLPCLQLQSQPQNLTSEPYIDRIQASPKARALQRLEDLRRRLTVGWSLGTQACLGPRVRTLGGLEDASFQPQLKGQPTTQRSTHYSARGRKTDVMHSANYVLVLHESKYVEHPSQAWRAPRQPGRRFAHGSLKRCLGLVKGCGRVRKRRSPARAHTRIQKTWAAEKTVKTVRLKQASWKKALSEIPCNSSRAPVPVRCTSYTSYPKTP